jgi:hypothetical protein
MLNVKSKIVFLVLSLILLTHGQVSAARLSDFTSDGCSLFPDGTMKDRALWCDCCFAHDIAYWQGGTREERLAADRMLRECVYDRTHNKALADMVYDGVRTGGHPVFPTWYRWAYGWTYGRGYAPLREGEKKQIREKLNAYHAKHPDGYCREKHGETKQ